MAMRKALATTLMVMIAMSGAAFGEDTTVPPLFRWGGVYLGANLGGVWSDTCSNWTPYLGSVQLQNQVPDFINTKCPTRSAFTGGVTGGINFVATSLLLGAEADFNGWSNSTRSHTVIYTGTAIPAGTYNFYGKDGPNGAVPCVYASAGCQTGWCHT